MSKSTLTLKSIESLLNEKLLPITNKIECLHNKVEEVVHSLSFLSNKYDELFNKVSVLEDNNKQLNTENQRLKSESSNLSNVCASLKVAIDELEQYSRRDCLELRGIPSSRDENTDDIVIKVASLVNINIKKEDISVSHRIRNSGIRGGSTVNSSSSRDMEPAIIVKFIKRDVRDALYHSRSRLKDKSTKDIGFSRRAENNIFIAENLTRKRKLLFNACLKFKKDHGFRFIWTQHGRILLRKDTESPAIHVKDENDLQGILYL